MTEQPVFGQEPTAEQIAYRHALFLESRGNKEAARTVFQTILPTLLAQEERKPPAPAKGIVRIGNAQNAQYERPQPQPNQSNAEVSETPLTIREQAYILEQLLPKNN